LGWKDAWIQKKVKQEDKEASTHARRLISRYKGNQNAGAQRTLKFHKKW
jgi:hypothetical protein